MKVLVGFRETGLRRLRVVGVRTPGITVQADPVNQAQNWLAGAGDLLFAGLRGHVPLAVRLGVLAHADVDRLADLGRYCRRGSVQRAWGEMARLAGEIAEHAGTPAGLADLQRLVLQPLELELLAGNVTFTSASGLIEFVRSRLTAAERVTPSVGEGLGDPD